MRAEWTPADYKAALAERNARIAKLEVGNAEAAKQLRVPGLRTHIISKTVLAHELGRDIEIAVSPSANFVND